MRLRASTLVCHLHCTSFCSSSDPCNKHTCVSACSRRSRTHLYSPNRLSSLLFFGKYVLFGRFFFFWRAPITQTQTSKACGLKARESWWTLSRWRPTPTALTPRSATRGAAMPLSSRRRPGSRLRRSSCSRSARPAHGIRATTSSASAQWKLSIRMRCPTSSGMMR